MAEANEAPEHSSVSVLGGTPAVGTQASVNDRQRQLADDDFSVAAMLLPSDTTHKRFGFIYSDTIRVSVRLPYSVSQVHSEKE